MQAGRKLDLVGGLVQLTFSSGATVIMQAPATFSPQAANGGQLVAGRLTVRVPGPTTKFWVRTPSMNALDLGTEFGISAEPSGASQVRVFEGAVEIEPANNEKASVAKRLLVAGEEGRIEAHGHSYGQPSAQSSPSFVRSMPDNAVADYMRTILGSNPWGYWNFNATATSTLIPDATGNGRFGQLTNGVLVVQGGSVLAVGPAVSLDGVGDWVSVPTGSTLSLGTTFSFEALFRSTGDGPIVSKTDDWEKGGKVLYIKDGRLVFEVFGKGAFRANDQMCDGQWHHVVVTNQPAERSDRDCTILYVDGVERKRRDDWGILSDSDDRLPIKIGFCSLSYPSEHFLSWEHRRSRRLRSFIDS